MAAGNFAKIEYLVFHNYFVLFEKQIWIFEIFEILKFYEIFEIFEIF